ncbi:MAG: hybrid sensor histidine kinase/response regulator, partial [Mediterranea sp.]|nr:hybrid sensor histidine kinase/response regulator [Mediterranea sp.]
MKQVLILLILLCSLPINAQMYKYIGAEDGLSDRRVFYIQKDKRKYMWFLTLEGIDRYNGTGFRQYKLTENGKKLDNYQSLGWLYLDKDDEVWEIGKNGMVFRYDEITDRFQLKFQIPKEGDHASSTSISYSFIDQNQNVWLCGKNKIYLYPIYNNEKKDATGI